MRNSCSEPRDLFGGANALWIWWIPGVILAATAFAGAPYLVVIWPTLLVEMGAACLINARRCHRLHCYVTGPFFLLLAALSLLYGLRILDLGSNGWRTLATVFLVGTCALTCIPEWIWGKYRGANHSRPPAGGGS